MAATAIAAKRARGRGRGMPSRTVVAMSFRRCMVESSEGTARAVHRIPPRARARPGSAEWQAAEGLWRNTDSWHLPSSLAHGAFMRVVLAAFLLAATFTAAAAERSYAVLSLVGD